MPTAQPAPSPPGATLCFSTLGCGELDLARRRGIPAVELRTLGGHNRLAPYLEARCATPERLRDCVAASGVRIASLDSSCSLIESTAAERADLLALVPWAWPRGQAAFAPSTGASAATGRN